MTTSKGVTVRGEGYVVEPSKAAIRRIEQKAEEQARKKYRKLKQIAITVTEDKTLKDESMP